MEIAQALHYIRPFILQGGLFIISRKNLNNSKTNSFKRFWSFEYYVEFIEGFCDTSLPSVRRPLI